MLEEILMYLNNWFLVSVHEGTYIIEDGSITLPFLVPGQYFRVIGSVFNDGLHQYPADDLTDETFDGTVWALAVPKSVVTLSEDMASWQEKNSEKADGPYQSESFAGYTYTKASNGKGGTVTVWDSFSKQLAPYRKPRELGYVNPTRTYTPPQDNWNPYPWR
jgi:hypothetical protein